MRYSISGTVSVECFDDLYSPRFLTFDLVVPGRACISCATVPMSRSMCPPMSGFSSGRKSCAMPYSSQALRRALARRSFHYQNQLRWETPTRPIIVNSARTQPGFFRKNRVRNAQARSKCAGFFHCNKAAENHATKNVDKKGDNWSPNLLASHLIDGNHIHCRMIYLHYGKGGQSLTVSPNLRIEVCST